MLGPGRGVTERSKGEAVPGMVRVDGGADQLREPREPKLPPPPMRASAMAGANASSAASAREISDPRLCAKKPDMFVPHSLGREAPLAADIWGGAAGPQWRGGGNAFTTIERCTPGY